MRRSCTKSACGKSASSSTRPPPATIKPESITAVILARNEERNLPRALGSLPAGMPAIVIDHESTDNTVRIARERGARTITRTFDGYVNARRFALTQVTTPWTLMIDADEALDARLRSAILAAPETVDGYTLSRDTYYCGKPLRMWRDERMLRLFKTDRVRLEAAPAAGGEAQLHERWIAQSAEALDGTLLHYSYPTHAAYREKFEQYTTIEAAGLARSAPAAFLQCALVPLRFAWYAGARRAVFDGGPGLRVAWWSAVYPAVVRLKALRK